MTRPAKPPPTKTKTGLVFLNAIALVAGFALALFVGAVVRLGG